MARTASAIAFIWDGTDVLNEYVSGALSGRYLTLDGEMLSEKRGANRYVYGVDPLGSVVHLLDSGLNRAGTYVYWPYGEVLSHTGADTPLQYVGGWGYYTATTNRAYVRARDYRPDLGRWMTEDPIGFEGGDWNLYGYVSNGPASYCDPSGRDRRERFACTHLRNRVCSEMWPGACAGDPYCRQLPPSPSMCRRPPSEWRECLDHEKVICRIRCWNLTGSYPTSCHINVKTYHMACPCAFSRGEWPELEEWGDPPDMSRWRPPRQVFVRPQLIKLLR